MKGNPAVPGGSLKSKPTWSDTPGCSATSVFLFSAEKRDAKGARPQTTSEKGGAVMGAKAQVLKGRIKEAAGAHR